MNTAMSPRAAASPSIIALPLPRPVWRRILTSGINSCATSIVPSTELPSTRMTSNTGGSVEESAARLGASFRVGTMIETATRLVVPLRT